MRVEKFNIGLQDVPLPTRDFYPVLNTPDEIETVDTERLTDSERASLLSFLTTRNVEHRAMISAYEKEKDVIKKTGICRPNQQVH